MSHTHGYAVRQGAPVADRDVIYENLGVLFDRGKQGDFNALTMDINSSIGTAYSYHRALFWTEMPLGGLKWPFDTGAPRPTPPPVLETGF